MAGHIVRMVSGVILILMTCSLTAEAQPMGKIVANPKAVRLRELWRLEGGNGMSEVGHASGSLGVGPNGLGMWAVFVASGNVGHWLIYHGSSEGLSIVPDDDVDSIVSLPITPIVGKFWGDERVGIGITHSTREERADSSIRYYDTLRIYEMRNGLIADTPTVKINVGVFGGVCFADMGSSDLDGDGADEVIIGSACGGYPSLRIYKGGPGFNGDQPTKIVTLPDSSASVGSQVFSISLPDLDGDGISDITAWIEGRKDGVLHFYISNEGAPWNWSQPHKSRRLLTRPVGLNPYPEPVRGIFPIDLDGDEAGDFYGFVTTSDTAGVYIWLSGSGRDFLARPLDGSDYDAYIPATGYINRPWAVGPLNDKAGRYEMLPLAVDGGNGLMHFYSGGPKGPDPMYDAWAGDDFENIFLKVSPLPDVNGDGWNDMLTSYFRWSGKKGIAVIFGGGPEIPQEHTSGVREEPVAGESGGLYLWPNPVVNELNIAWKGNLRSMPQRFEVYNMTGRKVAEGEIDPRIGAAIWNCEEAASGAYILVGYDKCDRMISRSSILKK